MSHCEGSEEREVNEKMNKEDVWQVIKAILKILIGIGIFLLLCMDSKGHINGDEAVALIVGFTAGWAVTFWHYEKKRKEDD